jgi:hypothetical protein
MNGNFPMSGAHQCATRREVSPQHVALAWMLAGLSDTADVAVGRGDPAGCRLKRQHLLDGLACHAELASDVRLGPPIFDETLHEVTALQSKPPSLPSVLDRLCADVFDAFKGRFV